MISPLLDPKGKPLELLKELHADAFGTLASRLAEPMFCPHSMSPDLEQLWKRLVAEDILLATLWRLPVDPSWLESLEDVQPLASCQDTLAALLKTSAWVVVIPLDLANRVTGTLIRLWGIRGETNTHAVEGDLGLLGGPYSIFLGGWEHPLAGRSWQLGAALAASVADRQRVDLQIRLARDWVITGAMNGGTIEPVIAGNKARIRTHRHWLVPQTNYDEFSSVIGRMVAAATLDGAWSHLSGEGLIEHGLTAWPAPEDVAELHATISQALRPLIASVLITRPNRLVLWHSESKKESEDFADLVIEFFHAEQIRNWSGWQGRVPQVEKRLLPMNDLAAGERALRDGGLAKVSHGTILFNVTCGNLIMRLAIYNVARLNPSIWLIYREIGIKDPTEVILIRNSGHLPSTGRMRPALAADGIRWDFINDRAPITSVDDFITGIFGQARVAPPAHAVTHPGPYHADDVVAGAILRLLYGERFLIERSEDRDRIAAADLVFDVGGEWVPERGRFDHHQGPTTKHPCGTPCASAGLLWSVYGKPLVAKECPDATDAQVMRITEAVRQLCILPVDAWDNGVFPDLQGQIVLPFQTAMNASVGGGHADEGYGIAVTFAMRILRGFIRRHAEAIRREAALRGLISSPSRDLTLLRDRNGAKWLLSRSLAFPLQEARDVLSAQGVALQGVIQPNSPERKGAWMITGIEPIPPLPGECFRSTNQRLVILLALDPVLASLDLRSEV